MDKRLYSVTPEVFRQMILPLIEGSYIWKGRPPCISHYQVFCAILYVLRVGYLGRDRPPCYGNWRSIYMRFQRGSEKGLRWRILITLQQRNQAKVNIILTNSTIFKIYRHGGGAKGGNTAAA
jgi:transposase